MIKNVFIRDPANILVVINNTIMHMALFITQRFQVTAQFLTIPRVTELNKGLGTFRWQCGLISV